MCAVVVRREKPPERIALPVFRNHPPGLWVCFVVELWERFSFYGIQALLIFFLTGHLLFPEREAYLIFGAYIAMVYMTPVLGGFIADHYLGARKAVTLGSVLVALGHFTLAFVGPAAATVIVGGSAVVMRNQFHLALFCFSLGAIAVGVGFVKTSCATLVGTLYGPNDPGRDSGFTIYYMSINIGGVVAPILCGWVAYRYGFGYAFALAGVGMLIGLYAFRHGERHLQGLSEPPATAHLDAVVFGGLTREWAIYALSVAMVVLVSLVVHGPAVVGLLIGVVGCGLAAVVIYDVLFRCKEGERGRLIACGILLLFTIGFWAFYEQMGTSLAIFADRYVDRRVFGYEVPAAMLQSIPSVFVLMLGPLFSNLWLALGRRAREPSTPSKFAAATLFLGTGFLLLAMGIRLAGAHTRIPIGWLALNFFLLCMGELCLAPMSQAMVTKLAPRRIVGLMMGCLLFSYSASGFISTLIAQIAAGHGSPGYAAFYARLGLTALAVSLLLLLFRPLLKRLSQEAPAP